MDLDDWEFIPDDGFLEIHDDGGKKIFSRKYVKDSNSSVFIMNYFPSSKSQKFVDSTEESRVPKQLVPLPIHLQPNVHKAPDHELVKRITHVPAEISIIPSVITQKIKAPNIEVLEEADQDSVSKVFFKKMKGNEFVDMKMDSPKSGSRGVLPQIDAGKFQFEEKVETMETMIEKEMVGSLDLLDHDIKEEEEVIALEESNDGLNIWKWSLSGVGAICSFGVAAAATICIIILGSGPKSKHQNHQKLRFQIYADDKRIKEVVHQASRMNEAMSAVRGVPLTRAQITFGGYYDGL